jgi:hypothetical protein
LLTLLKSGQTVVEATVDVLLIVVHGWWLVMQLRRRLVVLLRMRRMIREWAVEACMVVDAPCREGHVPPLDITCFLLILLRMIVSEITLPPWFA